MNTAVTTGELVVIDGGTFSYGSEEFYPEERPVVEMHVDSFRLDRSPVTNEQFARFVDDTGYVSVAERPLDPALYPDVAVHDRDPGSLVFAKTSGPVDLRDWRQWWVWRPGASWRRPFGADSCIDGMAEHPVVQVAFEDAVVFAAWAGKRLPTEVEWEFAARGGLTGSRYAWGDGPQEHDDLRANTWQGRFPYLNTGAHGWIGTSPVGSFAPNGYGLLDMTGNTWEWTATPWSDRHVGTYPRTLHGGCSCGPETVQGSAAEAYGSPARRVLKGGSHVCAPEYCLRYRPAARSPQTEDSATTHIGFRCAADL